MKNFSNIITPPNFINREAPTIALIDPEWTEVEDVIFYLGTVDKEYNVYVYMSEMEDEDWLDEVIEKSQTYIINTKPTSVSHIKDRLVANSRSYHYGDRVFLTSNNKLNKPVDYFIHLLSK